MKFDATKQRQFFDMSKHQYSTADILNPPKPQQLEYEDIASTITIHKGVTMLDYGCGSGRATMYFIKHGVNITGFDISETPLTELMKLYKLHKEPSWGTLDVTTTLPKKQFDIVIGADILHHITIHDHMQKIFALVKPGGKVVFTEPNPLHIPWYFYYVFGGRPLSVEYGILQCTLWNLKKQFTLSGFTDISIAGHALIPSRLAPQLFNVDLLNARFLPNLPIFKWFAFRYIISAIRPN